MEETDNKKEEKIIKKVGPVDCRGYHFGHRKRFCANMRVRTRRKMPTKKHIVTLVKKIKRKKQKKY